MFVSFTVINADLRENYTGNGNWNREPPSAAQPQPKIHKETRKPGFCFENSWLPGFLMKKQCARRAETFAPDNNIFTDSNTKTVLTRINMNLIG
jgi:hypothetical protein